MREISTFIWRLGHEPDVRAQHEAGMALRDRALRVRPCAYTNISHSGRYIAVICGDCPVGVDTERLSRRVLPSVIERAYSGFEREYALRAGNTGALRVFCAKEAYGKCMGVGLAYDFRNTAFIPAGEAPLTVSRVAGVPENYALSDWFDGEMTVSMCANDPDAVILPPVEWDAEGECFKNVTTVLNN